MPTPSLSQVHLDAPLTDLSVAQIQEAENYIADKVFPVIPVTQKSNKYFTYTNADFRRDEVVPRAPGTESAGSGFNMGSDNYTAEVYAFHQDVDDQTRDNADEAIDPDEDATDYVTGLFLTSREVKWASTYFTAGVWGTDVAGTTDFTKWDDASSDPEVDIDAGKAKILRETGFKPNTLVVGYVTHQALKRHPLVQDRFKYTSADSITEDMLAKFFEIDHYLVSEASYNSAAEGATAVDVMVMGDNALLCYSAPTPGLKRPSAGYTFNWSGFTNHNNVGVMIKKFRMEEIESDRVEGSFAYDDKVVYANMGYFFSDTNG